MGPRSPPPNTRCSDVRCAIRTTGNGIRLGSNCGRQHRPRLFGVVAQAGRGSIANYRLAMFLVDWYRSEPAKNRFKTGQIAQVIHNRASESALVKAPWQTVNLLAYAFSGSNPLLPILRHLASSAASYGKPYFAVSPTRTRPQTWRSMPFVARLTERRRANVPPHCKALLSSRPPIRSLAQKNLVHPFLIARIHNTNIFCIYLSTSKHPSCITSTSLSRSPGQIDTMSDSQSMFVSGSVTIIKA